MEAERARNEPLQEHKGIVHSATDRFLSATRPDF